MMLPGIGGLPVLLAGPPKGGATSYPVVAATATTHLNTGTASASHLINLPAGVASGDLLVVFTGGSSQPTSLPAGWNQIPHPGGGTADRRWWYRIADGSEGSTVAWSNGTTEALAAVAMRITGYTGTPECETSGAPAGSVTTANPASITPSWVAGATLFIAAVSRPVGGNPTAYPTGYSNTVSISADNADCATARKTSSAATEDPDSFTYSAASSKSIITLAVQGT